MNCQTIKDSSSPVSSWWLHDKQRGCNVLITAINLNQLASCRSRHEAGGNWTAEGFVTWQLLNSKIKTHLKMTINSNNVSFIFLESDDPSRIIKWILWSCCSFQKLVMCSVKSKLLSVNTHIPWQRVTQSIIRPWHVLSEDKVKNSCHVGHVRTHLTRKNLYFHASYFFKMNNMCFKETNDAVNLSTALLGKCILNSLSIQPFPLEY